MSIRHSLITSLKDLRGNARGCVYTEPLWGIPFNLYAPFASVYMLAFGLSDSQIGLVTSLGLAFQVFWTMVSGAITDKLGRRRTTLIFDIISWSVPCLIWAVAQNFTYFVVAAIVNSVLRVTMNSWQCLLVEDTDPRLLVDVWSWIYIASLGAAFFSPLTGLLIRHFDLVPTMRAVYLLSCVMMSVKFYLTNAMTTETRQGLVRMQETKDQPLFSLLREYPLVLKQILNRPATLLTGGLLLVVGISSMIRGTFWAILVTEKLDIPAEYLAYYSFARAIVMLGFFFLAMPRLRYMDVHKPMLLGYLGYIASYAILICVPKGNLWLLLVATALEACSIPVANTLMEKVVVLTVEAKERARIQSILYVVVIVLTSPFGWIAGRLSEADRSLPFVLCMVLFAAAVLLTYLALRQTKRGPALEAPPGA